VRKAYCISDFRIENQPVLSWGELRKREAAVFSVIAGKSPALHCCFRFYAVGRLDRDESPKTVAVSIHHRAGDLTVGTRENVNLTARAISIPVFYFDGRQLAAVALPSAQSRGQIFVDPICVMRK